MELSFGERLRQHRERQSVALATIATQTKIKVGLLEGLERDDISHWPGGIFRRSYIRAYAEAVGLDADRVVREFVALYPDPTEEVSPVGAIAGAAPKRPPTRLTYLISSAISALPSLRQPAPPTILASRNGHHSVEVSSVGSVASADFSLAGSDAVSLGERDLVLSPAIDQQPLLDLGAENLPFNPRHQEHRHGEPTVDELADHYMAGRAELTGEAFVADFADDTPSPVAEAEPVGARESATPGFVAPRAIGRREDISAIADLCTRLGRVGDAREVLPVLEDATAVLNAVGLILWTWDPRARALRPALSHGYSAELLSQVPPVDPDSDNAIGSAFRYAEMRIVNGDELATGALAVPLLTPTGCTGVLAAEFRDSVEQHAWVRSVVTILAAQLSMLVGPPALQVATA